MKWKDFISVIDVTVSILPSATSVIGTLPYFESPVVPLLIGVFTLFVLIIFFVQSNLGKKERALAEILATGYFINFLEPLSKNIGKITEVIFKDTNESRRFELKNIRITIYLPANSDSLALIADELNNNADYKNIDVINSKDGTPFWARAFEEGENLKIADYPRTLFSLPLFVKLNMGEKRSKKLNKYYQSFNNQLEDLLENNRQDYVLRNVQIEYV